ncbi:hypothetical protein BCU94_03270 [Shewanella sp. 10N.286.52.C2]|uniref:hypothetical protein n=1 Tax=Shewanella sp. 10N.286.52.C2 TaxID=1880838 RepID=UPI000C8449B2|nr:hypothetical protein [Shewanella sp. 10N.286.52.C2]PMG28878.1 hypothetical protein BCU94_03270 [Shewanella sp. 10N.286.52.C2]
MKLLLNSLVIGCCLLSPMTLANSYTSAEYQQIFSGNDTYKQKQAIESMILVGLEDPSIYNTIKSKIETELPSATDKYLIDNVSWLIKGLGYSGDPQYNGFLVSLSQGEAHLKIRKYAKAAIEDLKKFQKWNVFLQDKSHYDKTQPRLQNTYAAALRSDDLALIRLTARRIITEWIFDDYMLSQLAIQLQPMRLIDDSRLAIDAYAYVAKGLAISGSAQYKPVVADIAANAKQKTLRRYANSYLKKYY